MSKDFNICEHCSVYHPPMKKSCNGCNQSLVLDSRGKIAIWRLGDVEDGLLGPLASALKESFGYPVIIQPGFIDGRPSDRPLWNGRAAEVILNQMIARKTRGAIANLCVTEENIVPNASYNFLFGYAYMGWRVAAMGIAPLKADGSKKRLLISRIQKIAIHELGHGFGLDDHEYNGSDCIMCGDVEEDSLDTVDSGGGHFCASCERNIQKYVRR